MPDTSLVMLVDDDDNSRTVYAQALTSKGYEVVTAGTAEEALPLAQQLQPAAIVTDLRLPGASGLYLTRQLRADDRTKDAAILLLTGEVRMRDKGAFVGSDRLLLKPLPPGALAAEIDTAIAKRARIVAWARQLQSVYVH
jgi:CheY-like chemotaxis protein